MTEIRERRLSDIEAAAAALVAVHSTNGYPVEGVADPVAWLTSPSLWRAWIAERNDGQIVGHVSISHPQESDAASLLWAASPEGKGDVIGVLGRLFVLSTERGQSVGERLVATAMTQAAKENIQLVLDVMAKDASAARLYERLGWVRIGEFDHDPGRGETPVQAFCYVAPRQPAGA